MKIKILLISFCLLFVGCSPTKQSDSFYEATYPASLTPEYCWNNYMVQDYNLTYLCGASNVVGDSPYMRRGCSYSYFELKGLPLDKYLGRKANYTFGLSSTTSGTAYSVSVVKNKLLEENALEDYQTTKAGLYVAEGLRMLGKDALRNIPEYGKLIVASDFLELQNAKEIRDYICDALENECYITSFSCERKYTKIKLRICFEEYENLVWDSSIIGTSTGEYYFECIPDGSQKFVLVPDEVVHEIEKILYAPTYSQANE